MSWNQDEREQKLHETLEEMKRIFTEAPEAAVRSQAFIKTFHKFIADDFRAFLTPRAKRSGIKVVEEAKIFGSFKSKDVDVSVIHPTNGPLVLVGVRSQMSSVGKNVLTYYQDIIGEAISLQERFPMVTTGYAYLHPLEVVPWEKKNGKWVEAEQPNHARFAQMYAGIGDRDDRLYKHQTGSYDHFAYTVANFQTDAVEIRDDIVTKAVPSLDLSIRTFVPRMIETFHARNLWVQDIFEPTGTDGFPEEAAEVIQPSSEAVLEPLE